MALLYRFNLARLWSKTNPFTGASENWQHSFIIPLIGLYYLYVWRDDLLRPKESAAAAATAAVPAAGRGGSAAGGRPTLGYASPVAYVRRDYGLVVRAWLLLALTVWGLSFYAWVASRSGYLVVEIVLIVATVGALA